MQLQKNNKNHKKFKFTQKIAEIGLQFNWASLMHIEEDVWLKQKCFFALLILLQTQFYIGLLKATQLAEIFLKNWKNRFTKLYIFYKKKFYLLIFSLLILSKFVRKNSNFF